MLCYARLYYIGVTAASTCTLNENFDVDLGGLTLIGASPPEGTDADHQKQQTRTTPPSDRTQHVIFIQVPADKHHLGRTRQRDIHYLHIGGMHKETSLKKRMPISDLLALLIQHGR